MLEADDLADAHERLVPGMAPGTLRSRRSGEQQGAFQDYGLALVKLKRLTKEQLGLLDDAGLAHRHRVAQIWRRHLSDAVAPDPKVKDLLVAGGATWVVEKVIEHKLLGNVWNLLVHRAAGT